MIVKTQRNSAIELLRIISMFFIVMCHYSAEADWGGWTVAAYGPNVLFLQLLTIGGSTGNIVFLLISGYYMIESGVRPKNVLPGPSPLSYTVFISSPSP